MKGNTVMLKGLVAGTMVLVGAGVAQAQPVMTDLGGGFYKLVEGVGVIQPHENVVVDFPLDQVPGGVAGVPSVTAQGDGDPQFFAADAKFFPQTPSVQVKVKNTRHEAMEYKVRVIIKGND